jgi:hypothetical protein
MITETDLNTCAPEQVEHTDGGHEHPRNPTHELGGVGRPVQHAVEGNDKQQHQRLGADGITRAFGAVVGENENLTRGLQQVITHQQQKRVQREQQHATPLTGTHFREQGEQPFQR